MKTVLTVLNKDLIIQLFAVIFDGFSMVIALKVTKSQVGRYQTLLWSTRHGDLSYQIVQNSRRT